MLCDANARGLYLYGVDRIIAFGHTDQRPEAFTEARTEQARAIARLLDQLG